MTSRPPAHQTTRIWIQYTPGHKATVRELLTRLGAIFHYDFTDLSSFVVTLPSGALEKIANNPYIADYWYASMMTTNEPVIKTSR